MKIAIMSLGYVKLPLAVELGKQQRLCTIPTPITVIKTSDSL